MINYGNFLNRYKPFPFLMQMAEIKTEIVQCGSRLYIKCDEIISEGAFKCLWCSGEFSRDISLKFNFVVLHKNVDA